MDLAGALEIAPAAVKVLSHHAELDVGCSQNMTQLPQHFLHANVGPGIAGPVVPGEQQPQFLARLPAAAQTKHPADPPQLDERAHPGYEKKICHRGVLRAVTCASVELAEEGQGCAG